MGEDKNFLIKYVVPILIVISLFCGFMFMTEMKTLNNAYADMNDIEFLSSSTQRLISLALTEQLIPKDVFFIGTTSEDVLSIRSENALSVLVKPEMVELALAVYESWIVIEEVIQEDDIDISALSIYREAHFKSMTDLSNSIKEYTKELNSLISYYQRVIMVCLFLIALIMLNNILATHDKLKLTRDLAVMAQIDVATGLHNRSCCQDLFKSNKNITNRKQPAILVIDLNDLKKTNDSLGHRVGDELIYNFAQLLKDSAGVNSVKPFIGRYGGDEFIIYYDDVDSDEVVKIYLKELEHFAKEANEKESRFQISYAAGYAFASSDLNNLSVRDLFDKADENMYENKVAMKRAKNPNYDEQVAKGEDVR